MPREAKTGEPVRSNRAVDKAVVYVMWLLSSFFAILLISAAAYFVQNFIDSAKARRLEEIPFANEFYYSDGAIGIATEEFGFRNSY